MDLLFLGQAADVANDNLTARGNARMPPGVAMGRAEPVQVNAAGPQPYRADAVTSELPRRQCRGCERELGLLVDPPQPGPDGRSRRCQAVAAGEARTAPDAQ